MIYCGYQGVGKTSYCREHDDCIDLDSSTFPEKYKGWEKDYVFKACNYERTGKKVFISAHKEVIEYLMSIDKDFTLIIPEDDKKIWELRLKLRYEITKTRGALNALKDFKRNFKSDMKYYQKLKCKKIYVKAKRVLTTLDLMKI